MRRPVSEALGKQRDENEQVVSGEWRQISCWIGFHVGMYSSLRYSSLHVTMETVRSFTIWLCKTTADSLRSL